MLALASSQPLEDDRPFISEYGPDLVPGRVTVDDESYTARIRLHSGMLARTVHECFALLDTGSP